MNRTIFNYGVALGVAIAVACVAWVGGNALPILGGPVVAILLGLALSNVASRLDVGAGLRAIAKYLLQASIVLLGAHLTLSQVLVGARTSLPVMLATFAAVLIAAYGIGRALSLERNLRRLLAVGTAICGGSAIGALSGVIDADPADVAYALASIFLCNVVAVVLFPMLGHAMHLSQSAFGLWAGTAINDTSSVVAAAYGYGHEAGNDAVIVKLTRVMLIVPLVAFYAWRARKPGSGVLAAFPWFVVWFLVAAALDSFGLIPTTWQSPIATVGVFTITIALAAVGLSSDLAKMRSAGVRPLMLGVSLWIVIAVVSLATAALLHYA